MEASQLWSAALPTREVATSRGPVTVRGLNRMEAVAVGSVRNQLARERLMLNLGMVDPAITEAEAELWQRHGLGGDIEDVTVAIATLSGMIKEAAKDATREMLMGDGDAEFRDVPSAEVG